MLLTEEGSKVLKYIPEEKKESLKGALELSQKQVAAEKEVIAALSKSLNTIKDAPPDQISTFLKTEFEKLSAEGGVFYRYLDGAGEAGKIEALVGKGIANISESNLDKINKYLAGKGVSLDPPLGGKSGPFSMPWVQYRKGDRVVAR